MSDKGGPLPKFGEWNVNDPASAERFTVIFNKARDEKKTGGNPRGPESPGKEHGSFAKSNSCAAVVHKLPTEAEIQIHTLRRNGFVACNPTRWSREKEDDLTSIRTCFLSL